VITISLTLLAPVPLLPVLLEGALVEEALLEEASPEELPLLQAESASAVVARTATTAPGRAACLQGRLVIASYIDIFVPLRSWRFW
jgi:hypothetical protein